MCAAPRTHVHTHAVLTLGCAWHVTLHEHPTMQSAWRSALPAAGPSRAGSARELAWLVMIMHPDAPACVLWACALQEERIIDAPQWARDDIDVCLSGPVPRGTGAPGTEPAERHPPCMTALGCGDAAGTSGRHTASRHSCAPMATHQPNVQHPPPPSGYCRHPPQPPHQDLAAAPATRLWRPVRRPLTPNRPANSCLLTVWGCGSGPWHRIYACYAGWGAARIRG